MSVRTTNDCDHTQTHTHTHTHTQIHTHTHTHRYIALFTIFWQTFRIFWICQVKLYEKGITYRTNYNFLNQSIVSYLSTFLKSDNKMWNNICQQTWSAHSSHSVIMNRGDLQEMHHGSLVYRLPVSLLLGRWGCRGVRCCWSLCLQLTTA